MAADSFRVRYAGLWSLRRFLRPWTGRLVVMGLAAVGTVIASTVVPLILGAVVNGPIAHHDRGQVLPLFALTAGLALVEGGLISLRRYIQSIAVLSVERDIRDTLYAHLQRLPVVFHDGWSTGQLLSRATTDLSTIRRFLGFGLVFLVVDSLQALAVVCLLLATSWSLGLLVAATGIAVVALSRRFGAGYAVASRTMQDRDGDLATLAEEAATGIRVTKSFGRAVPATASYAEQAALVRSAALTQVGLAARFWSLLTLIPNLTMALVVLLGALAVVHGSLTLGGLVAFVTLLVLLQWPVIDIGWILAMAEEAASAATRVVEALDTPAAIVDPPSPVALVRPRGRLAFEGASFQFADAGSPLLHDVRLVVEPGETVAIVGATGSGKSTLTTLPPRLRDVTGGRVTLDGVDVRDLALADLRARVATAFEDPVLFSMSVRENLTLGRPDASDDDVRAALTLAQAGFVDALPWGLDTRIGEQGLSLSGGQRQRLALARAVVARPQVLVLDDPLSALDVHTEALVERALASVLAHTTGLLVVHRPSTVALADRVALLEGGTLTAVGTHSELMGLPAYASLLSVDEGQPVGP